MLSFFAWYVLISALGWLVFPLAYRLLPALKDRGFALSRALGLLLWAYVFWLLVSLGILRNDTGGLLFALAVVAGLSLWTLARGTKREVEGMLQRLRSGSDELVHWLNEERRLVIVTEVLFLAAFATWAIIRAAYPDIRYTEKPMEIGFINAILRSETFPPFDPWLSGYAISYYYFGYVMVAMLAKFAGTLPSVAFNLGVALVFAMSALGAYSIVYNLLSAWAAHKAEPGSPSSQAADQQSLPALFAPFLILLVSNIQGFLAMLHARGLLPTGFWSWLNILDMNTPPAEPFSWLPQSYGTGSWWWWRASRVVSDYNLEGMHREVIDEFPAFSYFLADLHPHVLAMPFAFLALALALNVFLSHENGGSLRLRLDLGRRTLAWLAVGLTVFGLALISLGSAGSSVGRLVQGLILFVLGGGAWVSLLPSLQEHGARVFVDGEVAGVNISKNLALSKSNLLLAAAALGGLAFLNTWDFPFYVALFAAAYSLRQLWQGKAGSWRELIWDFILLGLILGVLGGLLYLPFYLGFSSQAGGILPNLIYPTRGAHLWVMFATLLAPLFAYLLHLRLVVHAAAGGQGILRKGLKSAAILLLLLWLASLLLGLLITLLPGLGDLYLGDLGAGTSGELFGAALIRRFSNPGGWITLLFLAALLIALLRPMRAVGADNLQPVQGLQPAHAFALLLAALGALLVIGPEFFFLRDLFNTRMNTIFKFYYQAWLLWGVAAAFGTLVLLNELRGWARNAFPVAMAVLVLAGMAFTILRAWDITFGFQPPFGWTLDGAAFIARERPDEMAGIDWLADAPAGIVSEAVGGSYTDFARVSAFSGQPTVLGWPGHESQWRGGGQEMGSRQDDLARLYCTRDWQEARAILDQYQIRYVYIGSLERNAYGPATCGAPIQEAKFERNLRKVFEQGQVNIYEVPWRSSAQ